MHTDGHDLGKDTIGSNAPIGATAPRPGPGYETTDVNIGGVVVFLSGLMGFLVIFFFFCFAMGKLINNGIAEKDGPVNKWHERSAFAGARANGGKRQDLASNPEMQQRELQQMTAAFPTPRLDIDDGNQATADLHAREDLLLDHYSQGDGGKLRIPIAHAMELIAQRGLPVASAEPQRTLLAGDNPLEMKAPLTSGFARTGYELDTMETRAQKLSFGKAEASIAAQPAPGK